MDIAAALGVAPPAPKAETKLDATPPSESETETSFDEEFASTAPAGDAPSQPAAIPSQEADPADRELLLDAESLVDEVVDERADLAVGANHENTVPRQAAWPLSPQTGIEELAQTPLAPDAISPPEVDQAIRQLAAALADGETPVAKSEEGQVQPASDISDPTPDDASTAAVSAVPQVAAVTSATAASTEAPPIAIGAAINGADVTDSLTAPDGIELGRVTAEFATETEAMEPSAPVSREAREKPWLGGEGDGFKRPLVGVRAVAPESDLATTPASISEAVETGRVTKVEHQATHRTESGDAAGQIIAAIRADRGAGSSIDLRLDPPELGRVRILFNMDRADVVMATVSTERGETLDLLRRHAADLVRELERAGFASVQLDFSSKGGNPSGGAQREKAHFDDALPTLPMNENIITFIRRSDSRLDRFV